MVLLIRPFSNLLAQPGSPGVSWGVVLSGLALTKRQNVWGQFFVGFHAILLALNKRPNVWEQLFNRVRAFQSMGNPWNSVPENQFQIHAQI